MPEPTSPGPAADEPTLRLRALLGDEPPAGVLALDNDDRTRLADLLVDARRRQSATLQESFTEALKHVPFPARGIVKKVLLG